MISAIVAVDNNWGIGYDGDLLERIPEDMKYFKQVIKDNLLVCGKTTFDGLPQRAFSQRPMIIITRKWNEYTSDQNICVPNTYHYYMDLENCIKHIKKDCNRNDYDIIIIGGGKIYEELLPLCERVYVTKIYKSHENVDTYFPNLDKMNDWTPGMCSVIYEYEDFTYQFWQYDRI